SRRQRQMCIRDRIMVNLGLLFALSAPVTALGLPIVFVLVALSLVYWYDRQH
ncbi:hypothetical protein QLF84_24910, partial [Salmonella enterica subsp. enterica serovar Oslo]|nr:hypothetical protein [Salmonella enterica subsp. enterica serovar Oslo]